MIMRNRKMPQRGFSLVELMITISVVALLLTLAVPSFREAGLSGQLRSSANDLAASARFARSQAIKQNAMIKLCVSADGASCGAGGWEQGWIVLKGAVVLQHRAASSSGLKIAEANGITSVDFEPTGLGATPAMLTVCRATPSVGSQERVVNIDATGRPRVRITKAGACP
jgi:type IV fimbrial biogenesis protein FimT